MLDTSDIRRTDFCGSMVTKIKNNKSVLRHPAYARVCGVLAPVIVDTDSPISCPHCSFPAATRLHTPISSFICRLFVADAVPSVSAANRIHLNDTNSQSNNKNCIHKTFATLMIGEEWCLVSFVLLLVALINIIMHLFFHCFRFVCLTEVRICIHPHNTGMKVVYVCLLSFTVTLYTHYRFDCERVKVLKVLFRIFCILICLPFFALRIGSASGPVFSCSCNQKKPTFHKKRIR